jgi:hypothetical protein
VRRIDYTVKQKPPASEMRELSLLDLYCGCGGMSTGLCLGTRGGGVNLIAVLCLRFLWLSIVFYFAFLMISLPLIEMGC